MLFMERNELCWCGSGKKYKKCHMPIEEKILLHSERGEIVPTRAILKTAEIPLYSMKSQSTSASE